MIEKAILRTSIVVLTAISAAACAPEPPPEPDVSLVEPARPRPEIYAEFTLTADLGDLTEGQRQMIPILIEASKIMDDLFWRQAYGDDYDAWLETIDDADARRFAEFNYGPWDRLDDNRAFIDGVGAKPPGANFYPADMSKEEFEAAYMPGKTGLYSLIRRGADGKLSLVPYHVAYAAELKAAADLLRDSPAPRST